jgi:hypothetical protein
MRTTPGAGTITGVDRATGRREARRMESPAKERVMTPLSIEQANQLELSTVLRIKFASTEPNGNVYADASTEYDGFFTELPAGWQASPIGLIQTRTEATRDAWHLGNDEVEVVAVEHETGLELLLLGVATGLAVNGITALAGWGLGRWRKRRTGDTWKRPTSLVIEVPRPTPGGPVKLVVPPPVSDEEIATYVKLAVALGQEG